MTKILDCIAIVILIFVVSLAYLLYIPFAILYCIIAGIYAGIKYGSWVEVCTNFVALCKGINEGLMVTKKGIIEIWKS